jgi:DNA mismatch endonuclease (patch repair protein)
LVDVFTKKKRSWIMSRIRGKDTKIEKFFERKLRFNKIKFQKYPKILKGGNPDFLIGNIAVFIDGCFWHKCPIHYREPKSKRKYWLPKIEDNARRDKEVTRTLKKKRYKVIRFWEHNVLKNSNICIKKIKLEMKRNIE